MNEVAQNHTHSLPPCFTRFSALGSPQAADRCWPGCIFIRGSTGEESASQASQVVAESAPHSCKSGGSSCPLAPGGLPQLLSLDLPSETMETIKSERRVPMACANQMASHGMAGAHGYCHLLCHPLSVASRRSHPHSWAWTAGDRIMGAILSLPSVPRPHFPARALGECSPKATRVRDRGKRVQKASEGPGWQAGLAPCLVMQDFLASP